MCVTGQESGDMQQMAASDSGKSADVDILGLDQHDDADSGQVLPGML